MDITWWLTLPAPVPAAGLDGSPPGGGGGGGGPPMPGIGGGGGGGGGMMIVVPFEYGDSQCDERYTKVLSTHESK